MRCAIGITALLVFVFASSLRADPEIIVKHKYYNVEGLRAADLREQMNESGVRWTDGKTYDANVSWYVSWYYSYTDIGKGCAIGSVTTRVEVTYTLPRWTNRDYAPEALKKQWDQYIRNLTLHENGHERFGVTAAKEIEDAIAEMDPQKDCETLGSRANMLAHRILDKYRALEFRSDEKTQHGKMQGAVFP